MRKVLFISLITLIGISCKGEDRNLITMGSLLDEMVSFRQATEYPSIDYKSYQQSSYDRGSVSPDSAGWFNNNDGFGFIRTETVEGRTEKVLFEDSGAGVVTRIWITTQNQAGTLRFYFDESKEPDWTVPAYDLMKFGIKELGKGLLQAHTSYQEGGKGGNTLFLPITYAKGCKVTLEEPADMVNVPHYYHFNYRKYPTGTKIETFSAAVVEKYRNKIKEADTILQNPSKQIIGKLISKDGKIQSKDSIVLSLPEGSNSVNEIVFTISGYNKPDYEQVMRGLIFIAVFDGVETVWAPLSDFSGGGMGAPAVESWYLSADGKGSIISRWMMPYMQSAELKVLNASSSDCNISLSVKTDKYEWNNKSLYFHSTWKEEMDLPIYKEWTDCYDWNFTTINGRGVYRGDLLSLFNHAQAWYGEGDEKIWVDNDSFPSHFGTGTEDYYNSSWAPVIPFHTPFGGAPRADLESSQGYNAFFRTRNLDEIPFKERFCFDIEMLSWIDGKVDYATTVFWYGDLNAKTIKRSGVPEAQRALLPPPPDPAKYKIENAIEFESLKYTAKSDALKVDAQSMAGFPEGRWSGQKQLVGHSGNVGDYVEFILENLPHNKYEISIHATKATDYGIIDFIVNGKTIGTFDSYADKVTDSGSIKLGDVIPSDNSIVIRILIRGKNIKSKGLMFGLDCITLKEKR